MQKKMINHWAARGNKKLTCSTKTETQYNQNSAGYIGFNYTVWRIRIKSKVNQHHADQAHGLDLKPNFSVKY